MPNSQAMVDFIGFMEEYVTFLEQMVGDEREKLEGLNQRDISKIEHNIVVSLANAKKLEGFEHKREELMDKAGLKGKTFGQIVEDAPAGQQGTLQVLFSRFEKSVKEIKFHNDKSMSVAQDNLVRLDPDASLPVQPGDGPKSQYQKMRQGKAGQQGNILEQKA